MKGKYLVTTDSWFIAPDGKKYKLVYGEVEVINSRLDTSWFLKVGSAEDHVLINNHKVHYAKKCKTEPLRNKETPLARAINNTKQSPIYFTN